MNEPSTNRLKLQQGFWNAAALENARFHILGDERMFDPEQADDAFESAGQHDARRLAVFVHPEARVVDLGCGIGRLMKRLAPYCRAIDGFDISREMLAKAAEYLQEAPNATAHLTEGSSLAPAEDASVDFLYSLLCLIHVDKRSAWRYFVEIARVLKPGGRAYLQFHDMLSPAGFQKFVSVTDSDYPLEFYTQEEIRFLLAHAGLEVLNLEAYIEFMDVTVVKGSAAGWEAALSEAIRLDVLAAEGIFACDVLDVTAGGRIVVRCRNASEQWHVFRAVSRLHGLAAGVETAEYLRGEGVVALPPRSERVLEVDYDGCGHGFRVLLDGAPPPFEVTCAAAPPRSGPGVLHFALIPSGLPWTERTAALIPDSMAARMVEIRAAGA